MDRIARASTGECRLVFEAAAQRMALAPAVVEKDFWVCCTLDHLFHRTGFAGSMVFKGGTSLSKAFGLIERFSEDIDLILDWRLLGYGENEPWKPRSNLAQERLKADGIERWTAVVDVEIAALSRQPAAETVTSDRGKEFAELGRVEAGTGAVFYFALPRHPWQRGTNENTNGLLREYFPKETDFSGISDEEVERVYDAINRRPRKRLGFRTP